jgi:hypothetical protein
MNPCIAGDLLRPSLGVEFTMGRAAELLNFVIQRKQQETSGFQRNTVEYSQSIAYFLQLIA